MMAYSIHELCPFEIRNQKNINCFRKIIGVSPLFYLPTLVKVLLIIGYRLSLIEMNVEIAQPKNNLTWILVLNL
jgi:hypothetical protein